MSIKSILSNVFAHSIKKKLDNWTIQEEDIQDVLKQIRIALLDADVNLLVVKNFIKSIKQKTVGQVVEKGQNINQFLLTIIKQELIEILGKNKAEFGLENKQTRALLVGLQGSGKTTSIAKIANYLKNKKAQNVLLVAADIYRPAAVEQLKQLANKINVECFFQENLSPQEIVKNALAYSEKKKFDAILVDTAGRLHTNEKLMQELSDLKKILQPNEIIFVCDAMVGQNITEVATEFHNTLKLTGLLISKLDSEARAGAILSLISLLDLPVKFIGTGESINNLNLFHPDRVADQILGLGDVLTLAEKANEVIDKDQTKKSFTRMLAGNFDLEDLMVQMEQFNRLGSIDNIMKMMPDKFSKIISDEKVSSAQKKMMIWKILMSSMTKKERRNPKLLKKEPTRKIRIINGSGRKSDELNKMLAEWEKAKKQIDELAKQIRSGKNPLANFFKK